MQLLPYSTKVKGFAVVFALGLFFSGCSDAPDTTQADPTYSSIKVNILEPKCIECHSAHHSHGGIKLDSYQAIVDSNVFKAGNATDSLLYQVVKNGSMPEDSVPLSDDAVAAIRDWIDAGAENN